MKAPNKIDVQFVIQAYSWKVAIDYVQSMTGWSFIKARGFVLDCKQGFVA